MAVGSGHNGLVAAAYLAVAGKKVVVLERNAWFGGGVVSRELTLPGFRHDQHSMSHIFIQANPLLLPVLPNRATLPGISSVAVGDFNRDGRLDIAVTSAASNSVGVFLGNGNGFFQARTDYTVGAMPLSVVAADLGNGQVDLVVANHDSSDVSVLRGNGDGTFAAQKTFATGKAPYAVVITDVNGDGKPDIVTADYLDGTVCVLLGKGDGTFAAEQSFQAGGFPYSLAVKDVKTIRPPEVTEEFLTSTFGLARPEQLRELVKVTLERRLEFQQRQAARKFPSTSPGASHRARAPLGPKDLSKTPSSLGAAQNWTRSWQVEA